MLKIAISTSFYSLFIMSIVITNQQIYNSLPVETAADEAKLYLEDIAGSYSFVPRDSKSLSAQTFPWLESETGYYLGRIDNARSHWWLPSFGGVIIVQVGISSEDKVTQVVITGGRTGLP